MSRHVDVIIIGAGPAGMSAGACLSEMGVSVVILDEQVHPGGQIYRNIESASSAQLDLFGEHYRHGLSVVEPFRKSRVVCESGACVWQVESDGRVCYSREGQSRRIRANYIIVATGAMERPMPIPGWQLPGVMGAGAVNNLAKEAGLCPSGAVVLAGSGPLLLLEATLLIKKGVKITAILETTPSLPPANAAPHVPGALRRTDFLLEGVSMLREIRAAGVPHYKGVTGLRAKGDEHFESVEAKCGNKILSFSADLLMVHFGVIPNTHIFRQIGCRTVWNKSQRYWYPACDAWGRTNHERIFAAGDGAGVTGGVAAQYKGELAALEVARCLGIIPLEQRDELAVPLHAALKQDGYPRPFVDAVFAPRPRQYTFDDSTVICRCENVTVGAVRKAVREGARELNELKIMTRTGMGPCQGRMCGPALAEVMAAEVDRSPEKSGLLNVRPPLRLLPLAEVASMDLGDVQASGNWLLDKK